MRGATLKFGCPLCHATTVVFEKQGADSLKPNPELATRVAAHSKEVRFSLSSLFSFVFLCGTDSFWLGSQFFLFSIKTA